MEWCFLPDLSEVMIDVTDIYGEQLDKVLTQFEEMYSWTGVTFETCALDGEVSQWMFLLGATKRSTGLNGGTRSSAASGSSRE